MRGFQSSGWEPRNNPRGNEATEGTRLSQPQPLRPGKGHRNLASHPVGHALRVGHPRSGESSQPASMLDYCRIGCGAGSQTVGLTWDNGISTVFAMRINERTASIVASSCLLLLGVTVAHAQDPDNFKLDQPLITTAPVPETTTAIIPINRVDLFNGQDFTGCKFVSRSNEPFAGTWAVSNGVIRCSGNPAGYARTEKGYRNYKLTVEWRFVKVAPKADNTGVLFHIQPPDEVWPRCIQCQGRHDKQGDLFLMAGAESREHQGKDANTPVPKQGPSNEKPVGEWNTCEVICEGSSVKAWINGKLMNETTECTVSSGFIGFQSEGAEFEVRKVFLEPLK
jgi:hypothetical protein